MCIKHETAPRVIDNIIGALARSVIGDPSTLVDDIVVSILDNLPLKEDKDEYDIIFKFFTTLLASQHPSFHRCLPKIVECSAVFYSDLTIDKVKILAQVLNNANGKIFIYRKSLTSWSLLWWNKLLQVLVQTLIRCLVLFPWNSVRCWSVLLGCDCWK